MVGNPNGARALRGLGNGAAVDATRRAADQHRERIMPIVETIQGEGISSLKGIAHTLNARGILTARGGQWYATTVRNLIRRAGAAAIVLLLAASAADAGQCTPRMPAAESAAIKRSMLPPGERIGDYELDHIVPLCLCGSNDRANLQLQRWDEARRKDEWEIELCRAVDRGLMTREEATRRIREWRP